MSHFLDYVGVNIINNTISKNRIEYGKHQSTTLAMVGNGLLVEVEELGGGVSGDTEYFRHEGEEVSWARGTGPRYNMHLDDLAEKITPLNHGHLNLDEPMRREAGRAGSLDDLRERAKSLFRGLVEDLEEAEEVAGKIEVIVGRNGYELRYCGTVLWKEGGHTPNVQNWMTTDYEWQ